jgi:hypothetical protein
MALVRGTRRTTVWMSTEVNMRGQDRAVPPSFEAIMPAARIRADYDQFGEVAQRFGAASDTAANTLKSLQKNMAVLEGGDWAGEGPKPSTKR